MTMDEMVAKAESMGYDAYWNGLERRPAADPALTGLALMPNAPVGTDEGYFAVLKNWLDGWDQGMCQSMEADLEEMAEGQL